MEKNKNILIGGLLAIVLIMAVGYAAFATQLTVNGSAEITSTWDVHFVENNNAMTISEPSVGEKATGTMTRTSSTAYTVTAKLNQPGDKIVYTFTVENSGTLAALLQKDATDTAAKPVVTGSTDIYTDDDNIVGDEYIKFTVSDFSTTSLAAKGGTSTFTLTAEYVDNETTQSATPTLGDGETSHTATVTVTFNAVQA